MLSSFEHSNLIALPRLRWVERDEVTAGCSAGHIVTTARKVLQQAWRDEGTGIITWQDVPVEKE
jgi:hypothetical protein